MELNERKIDQKENLFIFLFIYLICRTSIMNQKKEEKEEKKKEKEEKEKEKEEKKDEKKTVITHQQILDGLNAGTYKFEHKTGAKAGRYYRLDIFTLFLPDFSCCFYYSVHFVFLCSITKLCVNLYFIW